MSFWSKLGKVTGAIAGTVGVGILTGGMAIPMAIGGYAGWKVMSSISGSKDKKDNTKFLAQLQNDAYLQEYVAMRAPGGLRSVLGMNDKEVSKLRHDWEKSPLRRLVQA